MAAGTPQQNDRVVTVSELSFRLILKFHLFSTTYHRPCRVRPYIARRVKRVPTRPNSGNGRSTTSGRGDYAYCSGRT